MKGVRGPIAMALAVLGVLGGGLALGSAPAPAAFVHHVLPPEEGFGAPSNRPTGSRSISPAKTCSPRKAAKKAASCGSSAPVAVPRWGRPRGTAGSARTVQLQHRTDRDRDDNACF
jgi:hypothetical protein